MFTPAESLVPRESPAERRFYPRIAPSGLLSVAFGDDNVGMLLNLSENGLLVSTPFALVQNFVCRISLLLNGLAKPIEVWVRVVWTSDSHRSGVQLLDLSDHDREQLRKWAAIAAERDSTLEPAKSEESHLDPLQPPEGTADTPRPATKPPSSRGSLLPSLLAAVLILAATLIVRGSSLRDLLSHFVKSNTRGNTATPTGAEVASPSHVSQAPAVAPATPTVAQPSVLHPAPLPFAPEETPAASTAEAPTAPPIPNSKTTRPASPRVRNRAILEAQKHFGDRYIGHLDLAGSSNNDSPPTPLFPAPATPAPPKGTNSTSSTNAAHPMPRNPPPSPTTTPLLLSAPLPSRARSPVNLPTRNPKTPPKACRPGSPKCPTTLSPPAPQSQLRRFLTTSRHRTQITPQRTPPMRRAFPSPSLTLLQQFLSPPIPSRRLMRCYAALSNSLSLPALALPMSISPASKFCSPQP